MGVVLTPCGDTQPNHEETHQIMKTNFNDIPVDPSFSTPPRNGFTRGEILATDFYNLPDDLREVIVNDDFGNDRWVTWTYMDKWRDLEDPNTLALDAWFADQIPGIPEGTKVFIWVCW